WVLLARGPGTLRRRGMALAGTVEAEPLREPLRRMGIRTLTVSVTHPGLGFSECAGATRVTPIEPSGGTYLTALSTETAAPPLRLAYGYHAGELLRLFGPLVLLLVLPVGITLALRRRALRDAGGDPAAVWFRFARTFRWVVLGTLLGWLIGVGALRAGGSL